MWCWWQELRVLYVCRCFFDGEAVADSYSEAVLPSFRYIAHYEVVPWQVRDRKRRAVGLLGLVIGVKEERARCTKILQVSTGSAAVARRCSAPGEYICCISCSLLIWHKTHVRRVTKSISSFEVGCLLASRSAASWHLARRLSKEL
jgi:hypothetical protein